MYRLKEVITKTTLSLTVGSGVSEIQAQAEATYRGTDRALYRAKTMAETEYVVLASGYPTPIVLG